MFGQGSKAIFVFDFNELAKDVLLLCQPALQKKGIEVQVQLYPLVLPVSGDKSQLQQVLLNLITNASEAFAPAFAGVKQVTVQTELVNKQIALTVTDNGSGISPEAEAVVFELLRTTKETGMGIGLWLSKTILDAHQGKISFTSRVNDGTQFVVTLPLAVESGVL
jgi:signal transduction histidine kinase